ncbi:hypothetical protein [Agromyces soli]|uniref:Uncharacterized protein n=1 Tax=Agromyces soli TaxID=659012 RepID=A0ABY4AW24_9MICO|nr:hypothetical protein [Agromyces soli]UOE26341.1 hypothetical protein MTP13_00755 [Agromyces soli]
MSEVALVEMPSARRAGVRRAVFAAAAGLLIVGVGFPAIVDAVATSRLDQLITLGALAVGIAAGGFLLASVIGYAASRGARRAASQLRQRGHVRVHWVRIAPENVIVALIVLPGRLEFWSDVGDGPVPVAAVENLEGVELGSRRIGGFAYYALAVRGAEGAVTFTLGTPSTWGVAEASRQRHRSLGELILHPVEAVQG